MPNVKDRLLLSAEELAHVRKCLDILQQAQNLCDEAAQALCSVRGFANEWSKISNAYEAVKKEWYRIEHRRLDLQAEGRKAGGCPRCGAALPGDGSCCDNCRWTRPA